jgi:hypothetical protein
MRVAGDISSEPDITSPGGNGRQPTGLTEYEAEQVREIAAWKSRPPNPFGELFKRIARPGSNLVERVLPDSLVKTAIDRAYDVAHRAADGVAPPERSLEECDAEALGVGSTANVVALAEGALTGAGGPITTLVDMPLLFLLSLRTIVRIGRCYGYPLDQERDRKFVLGVMIAAASGSLAVRLDRLGQLRDVEDWFLYETQEEIITGELASLLFQLEVFGEVPGVGAVSGALLNLAFIKRIEVTSRRVFEERWLRDRGKVDVIEPEQTHARALAHGWAGALVRVAYAGGYSVGYATALPFWLVTSLVRPPARVAGLAAH